jgi:hypothetical protein
MAIEKKSLISTLKTTKKANVASAPVSHEGTETTRKGAAHTRRGAAHARRAVFNKS